jgi:hypothetical protein
MAPDELGRHVVNWSENLGVTIGVLTDEYQEGLFLAVASDELDPRAALLQACTSTAPLRASVAGRLDQRR